MLEQQYPGARVDAVETVSGKVSEELAADGALAIALAMLGIAIYIWMRFEWQFGVGALVTLFHDVSMTLGFFSLTQLQVDLNVVAAILTIVGYSLNDTVVIYDRIRENLRKYRKMEIVPLLNLSLNETLSRTMVTSLSILLADPVVDDDGVVQRIADDGEDRGDDVEIELELGQREEAHRHPDVVEQGHQRADAELPFEPYPDVDGDPDHRQGDGERARSAAPRKPCRRPSRPRRSGRRDGAG